MTGPPPEPRCDAQRSGCTNREVCNVGPIILGIPSWLVCPVCLPQIKTRDDR